MYLYTLYDIQMNEQKYEASSMLSKNKTIISYYVSLLCIIFIITIMSYYSLKILNLKIFSQLIDSFFFFLLVVSKDID